METAQSQVDKILLFKERDKFSHAAWNDRGLHPSDPALCERMTFLFDSCADDLVKAVHAKYSNRRMKAVLKAGLRKFNSLDYDTEEREFICDLFFELATIVKVDFGYNLTAWMYGYLLATLVRIKKIIKPEKIIETLEQPCTKCATKLETHIFSRQDAIPETSWLVAKCNHCGELNLLSHGPGIKEMRFDNYQWVERLDMDEYTYEQALVRLEQIKFFRK